MNQAQYNIKTVLNKVLADLSERSQDVITSRFGIGRDNYETLEAIGQRYSITRERVRQIEADALRQIKSQKNRALILPLLTALEAFIKNEGGVIDEAMVTTVFARDYFNDKVKGEHFKGVVRLLLSIDPKFKKVPANDNFATCWYISEGSLRKQENLARQLANQLKRRGKVVNENELVALAQSIDAGLGKNVILNYLASSKNIRQNVFAQWGLVNWPEIRPKGVRDKAYLVMEQEGKPLHFRDVAEVINRTNFSQRRALAQTVHNELIKDKRFVLVGRGLYGLKQWGYEEGTVKDVIAKVLKKNGPLIKEKLIEAVLAERFVKPSTVILNLNSFKKTKDNKYTLV